MSESFLETDWKVSKRGDLVEDAPLYLFADPVFIGRSYDVATGHTTICHPPNKNGKTRTVLLAEEEQFTAEHHVPEPTTPTGE